MIQNLEMMLDNSSTQLLLAQVREVPPVTQAVTTPPDVALIFSAPQFLVALIAGVLMAFAFQFLLTNFTIAAGISAGENALEAEAAETWGSKVREVESKVGIWALITVNIAIFIACFLAVKLTLINSVPLAAITAVVIWSAYFLVLLWLSSTAINSLFGSVMDTASSGFQGIMAIATTALGGRAVNAQVVNTVEQSLAAVRRELSSAVDPTNVRETVQEYLKELPLPQLNLNQVRNDFEKLLRDSDIKAMAGNGGLSNINRQTFVDLVSSRTDFSKEDINRVADQLENAWQQVVGQQQQTDPQTQLLNFLKSATPEELKSNQLSQNLNQFLESTQNQGQQSAGLGQRAMQLGLSTLVGAVLNRVDLSDVDVERITGQLQQLKDQATDQAKQLGSEVSDRIPKPPFNPIKADVEDYLLNSKPWHLNRETIKKEFREVIYDPEASPGIVRRQLEQLNRDFVVKLLKSRDEFTPDQVNEIAEQLEGIRKDVFEQVQSAASEEQSNDLRSQVENYLRSTGKEELNPEGIERELKTLLDDPEAGFEHLRDRLQQFDRDTLMQMLKQSRQDLSEEDADRIVSQLESTRDRILSEAQNLQDQAKSKAEELGNKIESYLRETNKEELNPEGIKRELQILRDDPQAGLKALRERLSQFDRDTVVQLLKQRGDLSEEQINQVIDQFEQVRDNILHAPQKLAGKAQEQYDQVTSKIADYLRNTNLEELNPQGIQQDLTKLLDDPKQGAMAIRERLSQVDRETLVKLLGQREDLSEEQVNQIIDQVQKAIRSIVKAPRRLASRAGEKVQDFQSSLENYLRNTNKEELNPEGIKRDLQLLLNDPGAGLESIGDRFQQFDRSTLVSLLSQREDISEEEANQIVAQIESVRDQFIEQARNAQRKLQSAIDGVFAKIRNYLNSLERPELNYEGIKQDMRKLFDDPEAGFEALGDRLKQFDRGTLVALLSSREDISEADANRLIDQIEGVRDSVLNRAERLQEEAQKRVKQIKANAKQQLEETRKAAATAAWWLFGTALTSVGVAAFAGMMAVRGLSLFG